MGLLSARRKHPITVQLVLDGQAIVTSIMGLRRFRDEEQE